MSLANVCVLVFKSSMSDLSCTDLKIICDSSPLLLPLFQLSDEPLPGRKKLSMIGRNAASSYDLFLTDAMLLVIIYVTNFQQSPFIT